MKKKLTPMQAIKAKCIDCIVDNLSPGTHIAQIENCTDTSCALHEYRPLTSATKAINRKKRIEAMSEDERQVYLIKAEKARKLLHKKG